MAASTEAQRTIEGYKSQVKIFIGLIEKIDIDLEKGISHEEYVRLTEKRSLLIEESLAMIDCSFRIIAQMK